MKRRGPSHSGPFGLACTSCFKSKVKCVARAAGEGCQRCHRLDKQCVRSDSVRDRNIKKKEDSTARIAELESKLGSLISQLQSRNVIDGSATQQQTTVLPGPSSQASRTTPIETLDTAGHDAQHSGHVDNDEGGDGGCGDSESGRSTDSPRAVVVATSESSEFQVSDAEAEALLSTFRSCMLHYFPFVHLPDNLAAHQIQHERPFLFRAIICVASPSARDKAERGRELRRSICEAILGEESQRSTDRLDLLLALLTYISWGWDHVLSPGSLSRLMLQAKSLIYGMQLDEPDPRDLRIMALFNLDFDSGSEREVAVTRQGFLERHRAVLGCFVLSSIVSTDYDQGDALRWTPQMETGLAVISTNKDCPTDVSLAVQVRLQLIAQKSVQIHQRQRLELGQTAATDMTSLPALMDLETLQAQLREVHMSLSPELSHRGFLVAHIHSTELQISEAMYTVNSMVPILVSQFSRMVGTGSVSTTNGASSTASSRQERLQCLWQCVRAVQGCSSTLLALPPSDFRGISFLQWAQLTRCAVALNRLTVTIEDVVWDRAAVRAIIDLPVFLGRVADKLELVAQVNGEQGRDELFTQLARTMREFCSDATGSVAHEHRTTGQGPEEGTRRRPGVRSVAWAGGPAGMMPW